MTRAELVVVISERERTIPVGEGTIFVGAGMMSVSSGSDV